MKMLQEVLVLILTFAIIYIIANTGAANYILPIIIGLVVIGIIYILIKIARKKDDLFSGSYLEFAIITMTILLAIIFTGGMNSYFYFLDYFILFGISFIFEPLTVFVFLAGLIALFLQQTITGDIFTNSIKLGSLVLLSPIAYFFGRELKRREKENAEEHAEELIAHSKKREKK